MAIKEKIGTVISNKMEKTIVVTVENKYAAIPRYIHLVADFLSKYSFNMSVHRNIEINKTVPRAIGSGKKGKSTTLRT